LNISVQQDEAGFAATFNSVSDEEIKVTGCGFDDSKTVVRAPGESTTFYGRLQTADCTVTVTQGTETASSVFHYSSEVVTQGGDDNITDLNNNDLDFTLGTPVYDGAGKWTIETKNLDVLKEQGYGVSLWPNVQCLIANWEVNWQIIVEAPNGCMAGMATLKVYAGNPTSNAYVVHYVNISDIFIGVMP
jgi:hypothetical protein